MSVEIVNAVANCRVSFPVPDAYLQAQHLPVVQLPGRKTVCEWRALGCADVFTNFGTNIPGTKRFPPVKRNDLVAPQANRALVPDDVDCDAFVLCSQHREALHATLQGGYNRPILAETGKPVETWTVNAAARL